DASKFDIGTTLNFHDAANESSEETVSVTGRSGNVLTVVRGWKGTTAASHSSGATCVLGGNQLVVTGSHLIINSGPGQIEITSSDPTRTWNVANAQGAPHNRGNGIHWLSGDNLTVSNLIIHDVENGYFKSASATNGNVIDPIIYNVGYRDINGGAGRGWYIQNSSGSNLTVNGAVTFNSQNLTAQEKSVSGNTVNVFNAGITAFGAPFLIGASSGIADNISVGSSYFYSTNASALLLGYQGNNGLAYITGNYFGGYLGLLDAKSWAT